MTHAQPEIWPPYLLLGATFASAVIALALCRLRCPAWPAAMIGGLVPGAAIFGICYYLDARLPEGVYYLWYGLTLAPAAALFGLLASILTVILFAQLGDDRRNSG